MIYRQGFDFWRLDPTSKVPPEKITLYSEEDVMVNPIRQRRYTKIWRGDSYGSLSWTKDALEMCFAVNGRLFVMDTVLREPVPVAGTDGEFVEQALFTDDNETILYLLSDGKTVNLWEAKRNEQKLPWWRNRTFSCRQITRWDHHLSHLTVSPDGKRIGFARNLRELCLADRNGDNLNILNRSIDKPYYKLVTGQQMDTRQPQRLGGQLGCVDSLQHRRP